MRLSAAGWAGSILQCLDFLVVVWHFIFRPGQNWDEHAFAKKNGEKRKKKDFSANSTNIKEMFMYEALQVVCSFIICQ